MESPVYGPDAARYLVIETLRYQPVDGFIRLGLHLDRAEKTCADLGFEFDRAACLMALGEAVDETTDETAARCRLSVNHIGEVDVQTAAIADIAPPWRLAISDHRIKSSDPWLKVKTTNRALYTTCRAELPGTAESNTVDELIFLNEKDEVCEGTITNIFAKLGGRLYTPPLHCGLLPGILRQTLIDEGKVVEKVLRAADLRKADALFVGNSLRGLIPSVLRD